MFSAAELLAQALGYIKNKIPHVHECGGNGLCTTCRVRIIEGAPNLSPKTKQEVELSKSRRWDPSIRLACQCKINGDVSLQRLIWSSADVSSLQKENIKEDGAEEKSIAILFCDIRNYTRLSSANAAFDIAYFLNRFYTELGESILMNNGIIYQYVGDEIIGVFGTVEKDELKICQDALRAALGMRYAIDRLNKTELKEFEVKLKIGVGINFGKAYLGHLGHPTHRQFSVIGDPVNVASRIEGQTKLNNTDILISQSMLDKMAPESLVIGKIIEAQLAGKKGLNKLYEVLDFRTPDLQLELQSSLHLLLKDEDKFAKIFYEKVFAKAPFIKKLFTANMIGQGRLLTHMLGGIVYSLSRPEYLKMGLRQLGKSHEKYGVIPEYYPLVKETMLETISEILSMDCRTETIDAWSNALDFVIEHMSMKVNTRMPALSEM